MATQPPPGSELRIVLLRSCEDDENKVVRTVLNRESLTGERVGLCTLYKSEHTGRRISVVGAPGWDRLNRTEEDLQRSVCLCPPGPHALLLLVPVRSLGEEPSSDLDSALELTELLSERVWRHTIVLFDCDEGVEEAALNEHIRSADKILEKCGRRCFVLQRRNTQIHELFKKIDDLVEENHGDVFIPQTYYELIQRKTTVSSGETKLRHRRASLDNPPGMNKDKGDSEEKKETRHTEDGAKLRMDLKEFVVILIVMGIFALLGSVAGAQNGVLGSLIGIVVGIVVGAVLASFIMYIFVEKI